ncbi:MAG: hypothetical protein CMJ31_12405 [Phycisphaerae bacterium]|nr:hypothetical protein [Phycisphaerae bacterium]
MCRARRRSWFPARHGLVAEAEPIWNDAHNALWNTRERGPKVSFAWNGVIVVLERTFKGLLLTGMIE